MHIIYLKIVLQWKHRFDNFFFQQNEIVIINFVAVVVIISSAISWFTDWEFKNVVLFFFSIPINFMKHNLFFDVKYADPVISLVFVILIMTSVLKLLKASSMIMLLSVPKGFHLDEVTDTIYEKFPDILNIHEVIILDFLPKKRALKYLILASLLESFW